MGKLVRDGIPDLIRAEGQEPVVQVLDATRYLDALLEKIVEEAEELRRAAPEERLEEMADVYEVLRSLASNLGISLQQVSEAADAKNAARGGFAGRFWLEGS
ncbi:nucleoside triphosphate pyrophosphohydrolase [Nocardioides sp. HDW12B]|uniref:nucleoside triphosphate pyrophosphohydrolase n=1 Tax=Nocardioides sp. HDW12B TaxID=2714939 RepID=UPI00140D7886|nr:nucleoside triphosphate pyrophosphohydrolase [Nocardioides sp. HDW12B]QIK67294.1 nucleoside triphosphate pyrophosphohydrolase [Nocardioides sp. HDW12B]